MPLIESPEDAASALGRLLLQVVPPDARGHKTFTHLAREMGVSRNAVCKWLTNQRVPAPRVKSLVTLSNGAVTVKEFEPFVYNY